MKFHLVNGLVKRMGRWLSWPFFFRKRSEYTRTESPQTIVFGEDFSLFRFEDKNGQFDYSLYQQIQEQGNLAKIDRVWADRTNIEFAASVVTRYCGSVSFGICHGTRRGLEQRWFREFLGGEIIGTEIASTASTFEHTLQWDFHQIREDWIAATDFIYSNSWDHSYEPEACIKNWVRCLRPGGICLLEHSSEHEADLARPLDPFRATLAALTNLINDWGAGEFYVLETLPTPVRHLAATQQHLLVIGCPPTSLPQSKAIQ
jgi:SAM-dependent methyltransferase